MLPDPTNYRTDTIDLALNWVGDKGHVTASYFRSTFRDGYDRVTWTTYNTANATDTMTTPPSNEFNQLNLTGGYAFSDKTKLAGGLSYGRNTQNDAFVPPDIMLTAAPVSSLNGLVVTSHADLKLTNQSVKDWVLSAGVKYDKRDNRTASNFYNFNAIDNGNPANYPNAPLSNKKTQLELAGDYRLDKTQHIRLAYNRENINRWCDQYAAGSSVGLATYPAGSNCVVATASKDDKISATYKLKAREDVNLNVGYGYSDRKTDSDMAAITEFKGNTSLLGAGVNGGDFQGFHPFFDGSRKEQMLKAGIDWQATDKLTLGLSGKYTDDKYGTDLGVTKGSTWSLNLDTSYIYRDKGSIAAYLTQEHRERDMTDQQNIAAVLATGTKLSVPANSTWSNKLKDDDTTLGLGVKQGGLMGGKLDLAGDLTYSIGKTGYGTQLNYAGANNVGLTCSNPAFLSCGDVPDIKNTMIQFKLVGNYKLDKSAKVALGYLHQSLKSDDYYYNALQYGTTPTKEMPTNQQSGSYSVNLISAAYIYEFK